MNFDWSADEQALRARLQDFIGEQVRDDWTHEDREMPTPAVRDEVRGHTRELAARDLLMPQWPQEYGGKDASMWEQTVISEALWGAGEPRGPAYMAVNWIGPALMLAGTEEQKDSLLAGISSGEALWCQGFSEPDAGTDLGAMRTRARREGDSFVINGQKIWTSYAHAADYCFLLARSHPTAPTSEAISIFLVPMDTPGIEVREIPTMGFRHMLHEVFFTDVVVPSSALLGDENGGWSLIRTILANERIGVARHEFSDNSLDSLAEAVRERGLHETSPAAL